MVRVWASLLFLIIGMISHPGYGQDSPYNLSYSGRITQTNGSPLSGPVDLEIKFFDAETDGNQLGATLVYGGTVLVDGIFQIEIPLTTAQFHTIFPSSARTWIELKDTGNDRTYPRQRYFTVPYALKVPIDGSSVIYDSYGQLTVNEDALGFQKVGASVGFSDGAGGTGKITFKSDSSSENKTYVFPTTSGSSGQVLKTDGQGNLTWQNDVTLTLADGDVTTGAILDGTIANADISSTAAIATSKLSGAVTSITSHGLGSLATKSSVATGDIDDATIVNADISGSAAIADRIEAVPHGAGVWDAEPIDVGGLRAVDADVRLSTAELLFHDLRAGQSALRIGG